MASWQRFEQLLPLITHIYCSTFAINIVMLTTLDVGHGEAHEAGTEPLVKGE